MEKARCNTELYSNLRAPLNNVKPSNFWGSHQRVGFLHSIGGIELSEGSARVPLLLDLHRDSNMGLRCSFIVPLALAWDV